MVHKEKGKIDMTFDRTVCNCVMYLMYKVFGIFRYLYIRN